MLPCTCYTSVPPATFLPAGKNSVVFAVASDICIDEVLLAIKPLFCDQLNVFCFRCFYYCETLSKLYRIKLFIKIHQATKQTASATISKIALKSCMLTSAVMKVSLSHGLSIVIYHLRFTVPHSSVLYSSPVILRAQCRQRPCVAI